MPETAAVEPKRVIKIHNGEVKAPVITDPTPAAAPENTTPAPASTPAATEPAPGTPPAAVAPAVVPAIPATTEPVPVDLSAIIKEKTGGKINSWDELESIINKPVEPQPFKDDFIKGVVDYYNNTNDLTPYLQAKLMDWDKVSVEDLIKLELKQSNPDYSEKGLDYLLKKELKKYEGEDIEDEDKEFLLEEKRVRAERIRAKMKSEQQKFVSPVVDPQAITQKIEEFKQSVLNNENVKKVMTDKRVVIHYPDGDFNFELQDPDEVSEMLVDNGKWLSKIATVTEKDGKKQLSITENGMKIMAHAANVELYEKSLIDYGKSLGKQSVEQQIKNIQVPEYGKPVPGTPTDEKSKVKMGLAAALDKLIQTRNK